MTSKEPFHIQPLPGFLVVMPNKETKVGKFSISDTMADKDSSGVVVAIGEDYLYLEGDQQQLVHCPVAIGDTIIYSNIGTQMYLDYKSGEHIRIVRFHADPVYNQCLAVIKK